MNRTIIRGALAGALLILAPTLSACSSGDDASAQVAEVSFDGAHVNAAQFAAAVDEPGVTVVDVRTPAEFAEGHLPGAVNIDVSGADFESQVAALDPEADYAVYCRSGNRSRAAIDLMTGVGVTHTLGLEGGIGAWTGDVVTG